MINTDLKIIYQEIKLAKNILILSHFNPDGDAIGSMLGLKLIIEKLGIKADAVISKDLEFMDKLPNKELLLTEAGDNYDLTIIVDTNSKDRLGNLEDLYDESKKIIILDHHKVEKEIDEIYYIDSSKASATMIIYELAKVNNIKLDYDIAYYLYLGLLTDTGGFIYNNTNSLSLKVASDLLNYGINHNELYENYITPEYNLDYLSLMKLVIENIEIINNKIACSYLSYNDLTKYPFDTPKLFVDLGRNLKDIEVSLMFIEKEPNSYKVSLRSKKYLDVSKISKIFNGGGHKFASGIDFTDNFEEMKNKIIEEITKELK